jgi:hypothetical protein
LAKGKEELKRLYKRFSQPVGENPKKDDKDLQLFLEFMDRVIKVGWIAMTIVGIISFYLFITRELL